MRLAVAMANGGEVECCCQATTTTSTHLLELLAATFGLRSQGTWRRPARLSLFFPQRTVFCDGNFQEAAEGHR